MDDIWTKAQALHLEGKFQEAEELYVALLEQNHHNPGLMATLGSLYVQTGKYGLAIHLLEASLAKGLKQSDILTNLGLAYRKTGQTEISRKYFDESIKDDPSPEALANYSSFFIEAGESQKCIELCERAIKEKPELPIAHWNLGISLLTEGIWDRGWDEHEWGLKANGMREDRQVLDVPIWNKEPGTVLIYGEQGLGDEIMFTSMLPDLLKTNTVVYECHRRLETLFRKAFPEVQFYGTREDSAVTWAYNHPIDYRTPIGSLGQFYRRSRDAFPGTPYLKADPLPRGEKFRVGISWKGGGAKMSRVQKRSVPLTWWKPILEIPNVEFVSLQYGIGKEEDLDVMDALGYSIKRFPEVDAEDYYETARLVASCDLVISIATTVYHLAGALGVPAWVMTPHFPPWREASPVWYRSVRFYRQPAPIQDAWMPVVDVVAADLDERVNSKVQRIA